MLDQFNCDDRLIFNDWFGLFPSHIRTQLQNKAEARIAKAGQPIFQKGEDGPWLAALTSGRVRICVHTADGREMLISMVERGEICGERAVFDGLPRAGDAIAEEDTSYLVFRREDLIPALHTYPDTLMYLVRVLSVRLVRYMNTMELYAMQTLPVRLANFLIFFSRKYGKNVDGKLILPFNLSQTDLSRQIASSRESVNRQIKNFAARGLISLGSDGIEILNIAGLEEICTSKDKE